MNKITVVLDNKELNEIIDAIGYSILHNHEQRINASKKYVLNSTDNLDSVFEDNHHYLKMLQRRLIERSSL